MRRVYVNAYWISAVWAGAVLGTVIGRSIVKFNSPDPTNNQKVSVLPLIDNDFLGAGLGIRF